MCCLEIFVCMSRFCWVSCHLITNSKSLLAEKISEIIKEKPISSLEMDTMKNPLGKNWSSLSTNERNEIQKICKSKIFEALQIIEINDFKNKKSKTYPEMIYSLYCFSRLLKDIKF